MSGYLSQHTREALKLVEASYLSTTETQALLSFSNRCLGEPI